MVHPRARNRQGGEPQGSMAITANGENIRATKFRPKSHLIRSGKTGQPLTAAFLRFL